MAQALDITNQKFGKLTAIQKAPSRSGKTYWLCRCECGVEKEVQTSHLKNGSISTQKLIKPPIIAQVQKIIARKPVTCISLNLISPS